MYSVVLIRYPFDSLTEYKIRPVLVLSSPITKFNHLITAFITTKHPGTLESSDLLLSANDKNFALTGLKQDSIIRLHRLFTIPQESVLKVLGELPPSFHYQLKDKLKAIFKL
jgi:mRNA interferase MazF